MHSIKMNILLCSLWFSFPLAAEELHDPTRPFGWSPPTLAEEGPNTWTVTFILVSPQRQVAVINGQTVQIGEKIEEAQVIAITTQAVTLLQADGQPLTIPMFETTVKVPTQYSHHVY